jgi:hypothetical protein
VAELPLPSERRRTQSRSSAVPDDTAPARNEAVSAPPLSNPERLEILSDAVRKAVAVYMNYIDPGNGVSRDDALNEFIGIVD